MGRPILPPVAALVALLLASTAAQPTTQPTEVYGWAWATVDESMAYTVLTIGVGSGGGAYSRVTEVGGAASLNYSYILNVHVRLLVANQVQVPAFNVTYTANGTQRTVVNGEDRLEYVTPVGAGSPTVTLAFPQTVDSYTLVNSTTVTIALTGVNDVWVYYAAPQQQPPPQPPGGGGGGGGGATPPEQPSQPEQPSLAERIRRWFAWAAESVAKCLRQLWPWWLLLLLALAALLAYLWLRGRKRFVLIIEV